MINYSTLNRLDFDPHIDYAIKKSYTYTINKIKKLKKLEYKYGIHLANNPNKEQRTAQGHERFINTAR